MSAKHAGTLFTTVVHILTAMIGAGVLGMPQAVGNLGWVAGIAALLLFYAVAVLTSHLLADVAEVEGRQFARLYEAVGYILGRKAQIATAILQLSNLFLVCVAYTITAAVSMTSLANLACGEGGQGGSCLNQKWVMTAIFGGSQLLIAQLPNLEGSWIISTLGALTSVIYSTIALGLGIAKVAQGNIHGSVGGIAYSSATDKAFAVLNALGSIGFAYSFSGVLIEMQNTIREPPSHMVTMKRACNVGISIGVTFYTSVAVFGYMALGSAVPGDILTAFDSPRWLIMTAHTLVILHMVAAYNLYAQAFFISLESKLAHLLGPRRAAEHAAQQAVLDAGGGSFRHRQASVLARSATHHFGGHVIEIRALESAELAGEWSTAGSSSSAKGSDTAAAKEDRVRPEEPAAALSTLPSGALSVALGGGAAPSARGSLRLRRDSALSMASLREGGGSSGGAARWRLLLLSVAARCLYVAVTTVLAVVMPFFSQITGLCGSLTFWPLAVMFPCLMYLKVYQPRRRKVALIYAVMLLMLLVAAGAAIAAIRNLIKDWSTFQIL